MKSWDESIMEAVMDKDREYFEQHPEAVQYSRPYIPGEFPPDTIPPGALEGVVTVINAGNGVRIRQVDYFVALPEPASTTLH